MLALLAAAHAAEPSPALRTAGGAGLVAGTAGAVLCGGALLNLATSQEPLGFFALFPPGAVGLGVGTPLAVGAAVAQSARLGSEGTAGWVGVGLAGGAVGAAVAGVVVGGEAGTWLAVAGAPALATGALVAAGVQGWGNRRGAGVVVLPDPAIRGVRLTVAR